MRERVRRIPTTQSSLKERLVAPPLVFLLEGTPLDRSCGLKLLAGRYSLEFYTTPIRPLKSSLARRKSNEAMATPLSHSLNSKQRKPDSDEATRIPVQGSYTTIVCPTLGMYTQYAYAHIHRQSYVAPYYGTTRSSLLRCQDYRGRTHRILLHTYT